MGSPAGGAPFGRLLLQLNRTAERKAASAADQAPLTISPFLDPEGWRAEPLPRSHALAMVLWYHPRLISERSPVRFPAGCTKTFLSPLPLSPHRLTSYFDVWRHLPSAKIRIAQNNIARVNIAPKKTTCSSRPRGGRRRNHNSLLERSG